MSSKHWIEQAIKKPATAKAKGKGSTDKTGKHARLAETLLKMRKEKG
jgi:hypothetical protein